MLDGRWEERKCMMYIQHIGLKTSTRPIALSSEIGFLNAQALPRLRALYF